jgi:HSP20 family protein
MLLRFDPFRELDRLTEQMWAPPVARAVPMDAVRRGDRLVVTFDLPGVDADTIDLSVERNQLTLTAERAIARDEGDEVLVAERPHGSYTRRVFLGENLDTDRIEAEYHDGVLYVSIPVAEAAKPRRISVGTADRGADAIEATSTEHETA